MTNHKRQIKKIPNKILRVFEREKIFKRFDFIKHTREMNNKMSPVHRNALVYLKRDAIQMAAQPL